MPLDRRYEIKLHTRARANPVVEKYSRNLFAGLMLYAEGNITPFIGYPSDHHDGLSIRGYYSGNFLEVLYDKLISPIQQAAVRNGVVIYPAQTLWTPHNTFSDLRYLPGTTIGTREDTFKRVAEHNLAETAMQILNGTEVSYDFLFGGNAITLASTLIPTQVLEARKMMSEVARNLGMGGRDFNNILHITLARIKGVMETYDLIQFGLDLIALHSTASRDKLSGNITRVELMTNAQMEITNESLLMVKVAA